MSSEHIAMVRPAHRPQRGLDRTQLESRRDLGLSEVLLGQRAVATSLAFNLLIDAAEQLFEKRVI